MQTKLDADLITALKSKDQLRVSVLRHLKTALSNEAIAQKKKDEGLSDDEAVKVFKREANKRKDAIEAYSQGNRPELAEQEKQELAIIEEFLPAQLSEAEIAKIVDSVIVEVGTGNFGQVMGAVMKQVGTQADGAMVKKVVQEKLG